MNLSNFLTELKRRNVYKVAVAYAVIAWLLIQAGSILFPTFEAPSWVMKVFVTVVAAGFVFALFISWAFEMTPQGMKRTDELSPQEPFPYRNRRKFAALIATVALLAGGLLVFQFVRKENAPSRPPVIMDAAIPDKSIAVLPFENISDENAFFAVAIHDDVITSLAKIKDLKVSSRNSVMAYSAKVPRNLPEIRKELVAAYILEGSVRCVAYRVFVRVRLIDTATGKQIWEENYLRTLESSLRFSGELVSEITAMLGATITPEEKARLEVSPTNDPKAWIFYLRGRELDLRPERSSVDYVNAQNFYEQAIALDPTFVLVRARLSLMQVLFHQFFDATNTTLLRKARENAEEALRRDPNSAEAHVARAKCAQLAGDEILARSDLSDAVRLGPNDASIRLAVAVIQQKLGWEEEAAENYKRAAELAPREPRIFVNYGYLLYEIDQEAEARVVLDRALELQPESITLRLIRAYAEFSWSGDTSRAREILAGLPAGQDPDGRVTSAYCTLAILERKFPEALRLLQAYPKETLSTVESGGLGEQQRKVEAEAVIRFYAGDYPRACEYLEAMRPNYEVAVKKNPDSVSDHAALAFLYAWMSHCQIDERSNETSWKERAKAEAGRVIELNASAVVPVKRAYILALAKIYAWASEPDLAWQQIEQFRRFPPSGYSEHIFRLDPVWDPLRNDPRFQKLVATK